MSEQSIEDNVLAFFRDELSVPLASNFKPVQLEMDTVLQDYAEPDEFPYAIEKYDQVFGVDVSAIDMKHYYPWENLPRLTRWFKAKRSDVEQTRKPLTVRMFAESAKAGRWLYD